LLKQTNCHEEDCLDLSQRQRLKQTNYHEEGWLILSQRQRSYLARSQKLSQRLRQESRRRDELLQKQTWNFDKGLSQRQNHVFERHRVPQHHPAPPPPPDALHPLPPPRPPPPGSFSCCCGCKGATRCM
jgi:TolA-binding protein